MTGEIFFSTPIAEIGVDAVQNPINPVAGWPLIGWTDANGLARVNGFFEFQDAAGNFVVGPPFWALSELEGAFPNDNDFNSDHNVSHGLYPS